MATTKDKEDNKVSKQLAPCAQSDGVVQIHCTSPPGGDNLYKIKHLKCLWHVLPVLVNISTSWRLREEIKVSKLLPEQTAL